jgi:peroxiredoxin
MGRNTAELCYFNDSMDDFDVVDALLYVVNIDLPYLQNAWMREEGLRIPMCSDTDQEVFHIYNVAFDVFRGLLEIPERAIIVIEAADKVSVKWTREDGNLTSER